MIKAWFRDTRHKIIVMTAAIFLLGALAGKHFFIDPDFRTLKKLAGQLSAENQKEEALKRILDLDKKIKSYDRYFSKTDDVSWLIDNMNRLAIESGVSLVSITPQQAETDENLNKLILRMEARCGYHELGKFFSGIESGARLIKISNVSVQSQAAPQGIEKKLTVAMSLTAYYPRQNTPA